MCKIYKDKDHCISTRNLIAAKGKLLILWEFMLQIMFSYEGLTAVTMVVEVKQVCMSN